MSVWLYKLFLIPALLAALALSSASIENPIDEKTTELRVSGYPVRERFVVDLLSEKISNDFVRKGLAPFYFAPSDIKMPPVLGPGESTLVEVPIKYYFGGKKMRARLSFLVRNMGLQKTDDKMLVISNDPEEVGGPGLLLSEELLSDKPTRFIYFHKGGRRLPLRLDVVAENPNPYAIDLFVSKAASGPCPDVIFAGHTAIARFMALEKDSAGDIIRIGPGESVSLIEQELKEGEASTGVLRLWQLSGKSSLVKLFAREPGSRWQPDEGVRGLKENGRLSGSLGEAFVDVEREFSLGSSPLDIRLGETPALYSEKRGFDVHLGNYGLIHRIKLRVKNPSKKQGKVSLYYAAAGGPARGVFIYRSSLIETGLLDPKTNKSEKLLSVKVAPGAAEEIFIEVMPQPGSFYPTRLVLMGEKP